MPSAIDRLPWYVAIATSAAAVAIGIVFGTFAAGGSDSACYVSAARLFSRGTTRVDQPLARLAPWPSSAWSFTPAGHTLSPSEPNIPTAFVPMCPPGLPIVMAAARLIRVSEFLVVPLFGGMAVFMAFLAGRRIAGAVTGAATAVLTLCSPIFLYQLVQPMTDVPATAWWLLVVVLAIGGGRRGARPLAAGLAASMAILTRPNLAPLAAIVLLYFVFVRPSPTDSSAQHLSTLAGPHPRSTRAAPVFVSQPRALTRYPRAGRRRSPPALMFLAGIVPGVMLLAWLQNAMYGSPLATGYGPAEAMFGVDSLAPNLRRYTEWLVETHTPFLALVIAAPFVVRPRAPVWLCLALALTTVACYLPYRVFDDWWYIRFLLPAIPLLIVLSASGLSAIGERLAPRSRVWTTALVIALLAAWWVHVANVRLAFSLRDWEHHFVEAGTYVAERLPPRAVVFTVKHSGSVHFYAERPIVTWNLIEPEWLDRAVAFLSDQGYAPYLLIDIEEEAAFRSRFGRASVLGGLDWPPVARVGHAIRVYGLRDRARFLAGEIIATEDVSSTPPRRRRRR